MTTSPDIMPQTLDAFSPQRPLLLLTEFPADAKGGGAVILRSLLTEAERSKIVWLTLTGPAESNPAIWAGQVRLGLGEGKSANRSVLRDSLWGTRGLVNEINQIAKNRNAGAVWAVLHGAVVHIAAGLARHSSLPMHATVHDDPPFATTLRSRRVFLLMPLVDRDFGFALRKARSVDVICKSMGDRYRKRYGADSIVVHRGVHPDAIKPAVQYDRQKNGLRIGVLGNTYNYEQLPLLARSLIAAAGKLHTKPRITIFGQGYGARLKQDFGDAIEVDIKGHLDEASAIPALQECFMLYLNYPFGRLCKVLRQTSFPTKLSTYMMSSRPILLHAPSDSSTADLAKMSPYFSMWSNNNVAQGTQLLIDCWMNDTYNASFHDQAESLRHQFYDYQTNRQTLLMALNALALRM